MYQNHRAMLCAATIALAGGAAVSAGTIVEIPNDQRARVNWSGNTGCNSASITYQPTSMHGGYCTLNTLTYTYSGKRISMWNFDLSDVPHDAEITSLAVRFTGGEGYYSAEGQQFRLAMKPGSGTLNSGDGNALINQGVVLGQPAPFEEAEYELSTSEIIDAHDTTGWIVFGMSWPYGGIEYYSYLGPDATLLVEYALCDADIDDSGAVNVTDLLAVIGEWGTNCNIGSGCSADTDGSGFVDVSDLLAVIDGWGFCD